MVLMSGDAHLVISDISIFFHLVVHVGLGDLALSNNSESVILYRRQGNHMEVLV